MAESFTQSELASFIAAADSSYPRKMYSAGKKEKTIFTAAELSALGSGWFTKPVQ